MTTYSCITQDQSSKTDAYPWNEETFTNAVGYYVAMMDTLFFGGHTFMRSEESKDSKVQQTILGLFSF